MTDIATQIARAQTKVDQLWKDSAFAGGKGAYAKIKANRTVAERDLERLESQQCWEELKNSPEEAERIRRQEEYITNLEARAYGGLR